MNKQYREFTAKEKAWLKTFDKVMRAAPDTLFMFVGAGINVFAKDENNLRYMQHRSGSDSVDGNASSFTVRTKIDYDGGDY